MNIVLDNKWDDGMTKFSIDNLDDVDCILHGRKTGEGFIPYWNDIARDPGSDFHYLGKRISAIQNAIFSNTLNASAWENIIILNGSLINAIKDLKNKNGKNIMVYGGDSFVASLLENDLVDELCLQINPAAIGNGEKSFNPLRSNSKFKLAECKEFDCGVLLLRYLVE